MSVNVDLFPEIELGNIVSCRQDWAYASACCWTAATAQYAGEELGIKIPYTVKCDKAREHPALRVYTRSIAV